MQEKNSHTASICGFKIKVPESNIFFCEFHKFLLKTNKSLAQA